MLFSFQYEQFLCTCDVFLQLYIEPFYHPFPDIYLNLAIFIPPPGYLIYFIFSLDYEHTAIYFNVEWKNLIEINSNIFNDFDYYKLFNFNWPEVVTYQIAALRAVSCTLVPRSSNCLSNRYVLPIDQLCN